jgi:hypothetical protein
MRSPILFIACENCKVRELSEGCGEMSPKVLVVFADVPPGHW